MKTERPPFDIDALIECARLIERLYRTPGLLNMSVGKDGKCKVTLTKEMFTELFAGKKIDERQLKPKHHWFEYSFEYKGVTFCCTSDESIKEI